MTPSGPAVSPLMARALALARSVRGVASPNPPVGAVLAHGDEVVGEGATQPPGGAHAEVMAIAAAGPRARGATLYVTLEPCATHGRTPPCTQAIRDAAIAAVTIAAGDADPAVDGRGIAALRDAGLTLRFGDGDGEARRLYEAYSHQRRTGRPFVITKFAASLDGKIAATGGDSRWISGPEARVWAHGLRPFVDAILVGVETVLLDDPQLTARVDGELARGHQPLRVVLDSRGRTPLAALVLQQQDLARTLVATTAAAPQQWRREVEAGGAALRVLPAGDGGVDLSALLDLLAGEFGIVSLLVEGGGRVHGAFVDARLVNKVHAVIAPMIIGGEAPSTVAGRGVDRLAAALRLRDLSVEQLGDDILLTGYPAVARSLDAVRVRPAGLDDLPAYLALIADAAQRSALEPAVHEAFARLERNMGTAWVALEARLVIGGVCCAFRDPSHDDRDGGKQAAALGLLYLALDWRDNSLAARLVEAAEASVGGRGFRWLTLVLDEAGDAGIWSRSDWAARGFRYLRQAEDGTVVLIKDLES